MRERKVYLIPRVGDKVRILRTKGEHDGKEFTYFNDREGVVVKTAWFLRPGAPVQVRFRWGQHEKAREEWFHQFALEVIERVA